MKGPIGKRPDGCHAVDYLEATNGRTDRSPNCLDIGGPATRLPIALLRPPAVGDNAAMIDPPKDDQPKRKRRWFQFSLRTLLIGGGTINIGVPIVRMAKGASRSTCSLHARNRRSKVPGIQGRL